MTVFDFRGDTELRGEELIGREIVIRWETGLWYDAVVVQYYEDEDEHKIVYRYDDGIEITRLTNRRWVLLAKKSATTYKKPVLDGAIVRFVYPVDKRIYQGMIYDHNNSGSIIKIAYLTEHSTDVLKGTKWDFVTASPCSLDDGQAGPSSAVSSSSTDLDDSPRLNKNSRQAHRSYERGQRSPERIYGSPERIYGSPERIYRSPGQVHNSPERVHSSPERVHSSPERVHNSPERVHSSPERIYRSPERGQRRSQRVHRRNAEQTPVRSSKRTHRRSSEVTFRRRSQQPVTTGRVRKKRTRSRTFY